jgi:heme-degrading monooxygenase HmoA
MYAAIRRLKMKPGLIDEAVRRIENGFVPLLRSVPGFVEYVGVQVGEDEGLTISLFKTQEQAEESTRRAAEWVKQNLAPLAAGPLEIVAVGEVRFRKAQ